jgi:hypothetical protein
MASDAGKLVVVAPLYTPLGVLSSEIGERLRLAALSVRCGVGGSWIPASPACAGAGMTASWQGSVTPAEAGGHALPEQSTDFAAALVPMETGRRPFSRALPTNIADLTDPEDGYIISAHLKGLQILQGSIRAREGWLTDLATALSDSEKEDINTALNILTDRANQLSQPVELSQ